MFRVSQTEGVWSRRGTLVHALQSIMQRINADCVTVGQHPPINTLQNAQSFVLSRFLFDRAEIPEELLSNKFHRDLLLGASDHE
jgi:hypothetical protein